MLTIVSIVWITFIGYYLGKGFESDDFAILF